MMNYLERNALVIAEMRAQFQPMRGQVVGRSDKTTVTSLGSYPSELFRSRLHIALKEVRREGEAIDYWQRLINDLTAVAGIANNLPQLLPELPFFVGVIQNPTDEYRGIITEDLTQGRVVTVRQLHEGNLPKDDPTIEALRSLLSSPGFTCSDETLANIFFDTEMPDRGLARRMGDFDQIRLYLGLKRIRERLPYDAVVTNVSQHTLVINKNI